MNQIPNNSDSNFKKLNHLSIVIPIYRAENVLDELVSRIELSVKQITDNFEILLIDDRSPDKSWVKMKEISNQNPRVRSIRLSRNFGQHYAITAGLDHARGEWVIVMDCDLQDQPEEIPRLYKKAIQGYEIVLARRAKRKDSPLKVLTSKLFFAVFGYLTDTQQDAAVANFGIYNWKVVKAILSMGDYFRVFPILVQWVGFRRTKIDVEHSNRKEGKSNYSVGKLIRLAMDMIISFSDKPLRLTLKIGLYISISSFTLGLIYLINFIAGLIQVPGFTSLFLLLTFNLGITLSFIGMLGLYIGKISIQIKGRPVYIVDENIN